jgi:hypothetical protein
MLVCIVSALILCCICTASVLYPPCICATIALHFVYGVVLHAVFPFSDRIHGMFTAQYGPIRIMQSVENTDQAVPEQMTVFCLFAGIKEVLGSIAFLFLHPLSFCAFSLRKLISVFHWRYASHNICYV